MAAPGSDRRAGTASPCSRAAASRSWCGARCPATWPISRRATSRRLSTASSSLRSTYPQPGPKFEHKLAWFERLLAHAATLVASSRPVVLAGDYNVVPTDADIYSPASWLDNALLQPQPRAAYARLLAQGWTDALRKRHPGARLYTFWDYRRNRWQRDAGLRIDHLLLSPAVAKRLRDAGVDRALRGLDEPSDHAPAWITLASA